MSRDPKVSIIIAAYKAADCVGEAIASCLAQTEPDFEVIVVDDASPESLESAVEAASGNDPRVRFFRLPKNSGPSGARNKALGEARGTYVAILDADDTMLPDRLAQLLAAAEAQSADIIVDNMIANHVDSPLGRQPFLDQNVLSDPQVITLAAYADPDTTTSYGAPLGYLKPLIRRQLIEELSLRYDTALTNSEDYYFIAELLAAGAEMILIPYSGYLYTIQAGSISHRLRPAQTAAILTAEQTFLERHKGQFDRTFEPASKRRRALLRKSHQFETLIDDLRKRHPLAFLKNLLFSGANLPAHLLNFGKIALKRAR